MGYEVMSCFTPDSAPVISTLAQEFALFDHYHAAVPGPTQVNRMYIHSATSHGAAYNDDNQMVLGYPQKTIFKSLADSKVDWGVYFGDIPGTLLFTDMRSVEALSRFHDMELFEGKGMIECDHEKVVGGFLVCWLLQWKSHLLHRPLAQPMSS